MNLSEASSARTVTSDIASPPSPAPELVRLWYALVVGGCVLCHAAARVYSQEEREARYMIVVTGSELLNGVYADGHTHFLTRTLRPLGWRCVGSVSVDDKPDDLKQALKFATSKAPLIIVTGGLGPTDTDITRETLADFTGIAVREHPDLLREMERRFNVPRTKLRPNLRRQTQTPIGGGYLRNARGTAAGLVFKLPHGGVVALPGPPRELQPMVHNELIPYLSRQYGTRLPGCSLTLRFVGVGQSRVNQTLNEQAILPQDAELTTQFAEGRVDFTFALPEDTARQRKQLHEIEKRVRQYLGDFVYASDATTLEAHVLAQLAERGQTLAIAEVGSGGGLSRGLNSAPGSLGTLAGAYIAPSEDRLRQLLRISSPQWQQATTSAARAEQLAMAVAKQSGGSWGVAVGQTTRQTTGAAQLEIAIHAPGGRLETHSLRLAGSGASSKARLATTILDRLRRRLR